MLYHPNTADRDMYKNILLLLLAASLLAGPSFAQNPPAADRPNNNAVNSSGQNNSSKPVAGANSFTEGQAKIQDRGRRLHQRYIPEEGQERRLARKGQ